MSTSAKTNRKSRKVKFEMDAADGSSVFVAGSFNDWDPEAIRLKKNGSGVYSASVSLPPGRHEYKFLVNGDWQIDGHCQQMAPNSFGSLNCVLEVT